MIRRPNLDGSMGIAAGLQQTGGGLFGAFKLTGDDTTPGKRSLRRAPRGRIVHELQMLRPAQRVSAQHICRRSATARGTPSRADLAAPRPTITIACDNPAHAKPRSDAESDADVRRQDKARALGRTAGASRLATEDVGAKTSEEIGPEKSAKTSTDILTGMRTDGSCLAPFSRRVPQDHRAAQPGLAAAGREPV
jgi:hypothetical protein